MKVVNPFQDLEHDLLDFAVLDFLLELLDVVVQVV